MPSSHKNLYAESHNPHMTVFGDRAFRQVFRLNEVLRAEPQPKRTGVLIRKGRDTRDLAPPHTHTEQAV